MYHVRQQVVESGEIENRESESEEFGVVDNTSAKDLGRTVVSTIDANYVKS